MDEKELSYEDIIAQYQAENEKLREQLADVRLKGYYRLMHLTDDIKSFIRSISVSSFLVGYFLALLVVYILGCLEE